MPLTYKAEIKTVSSNEPNSRRSTHYDLYVDGKYKTTFQDVIDAVDERDKINFGKHSEARVRAQASWGAGTDLNERLRRRLS